VVVASDISLEEVNKGTQNFRQGSRWPVEILTKRFMIISLAAYLKPSLLEKEDEMCQVPPESRNIWIEAAVHS
jgi:hypothetical protein